MRTPGSEASRRRASVAKRVRSFANANAARFAATFFKTGPGQYGEGDRFLGIRVPVMRKLAREFKDIPFDDAVALLESEWHEERLLGLMLLGSMYGRAGAKDRERIYRAYLANTSRINSWDLVDASAPHIVGAHLETRSRAPLTRLARSKLLWDRRIAIIATQHFIRRGDFADALRIAKVLVDDEHDLIHKAVGWMLREIGKRDIDAERAFLDVHAATMPRTMLRYAIERFPQPERQRYMALGNRR